MLSVVCLLEFVFTVVKSDLVNVKNKEKLKFCGLAEFLEKFSETTEVSVPRN